MIRYLSIVCLGAALGGCASIPQPTLGEKRSGLVVVVPGIEGRSYLNADIVRGLKEGGVRYAVELFDWSTWAGPLGWYTHLTDTRRNHYQASRLATRVSRYRRQFPARPVYIVAHSGGAGIAIAAAELLPEAAPLDGIILLAAAVSPGHDLTAALRRTRFGIWNFHSPGDVGFLVAGTLVFGNMDREHAPSAGAFGFEIPPSASAEKRELYQRALHQIKYKLDMVKDGNLGLHTGWTHPKFVARWLAPIVMSSELPELRIPEEIDLNRISPAEAFAPPATRR